MATATVDPTANVGATGIIGHEPWNGCALGASSSSFAWTNLSIILPSNWAPPPASSTNVLTVANVGANEYLVTFDASVFTTFATSWQPQLLAFSPSADSGHGAWRTVTWIDHPTAPTIHVDAGAADCTIFAVLGQLSGITATLPFAAPALTPIT